MAFNPRGFVKTEFKSCLYPLKPEIEGQKYLQLSTRYKSNFV